MFDQLDGWSISKFADGSTGGIQITVKVFLNHRQSAAGEVAVAVGEVAVVALDERVEAEASVLPEGNLAQEEVGENGGGEQIPLAVPVLVAQNRTRQVDGLRLQRPKSVEDRLGANDVAL